MFATLSAVSGVALASLLSLNQMDTVDRDLTGTRAGELLARFEAATILNPATTSGWYSGRCYKTATPNNAYGSIGAIELRPSTDDGGGPLFGNGRLKVIIMGLGEHGSDATANPAVFDELSDEHRAIFNNTVDDVFYFERITNAVPRYNSLVSTYTAGYTRYEFRKSEDYIFTRTVNIETNLAISYCYYFKKIK